MGEITSFKKKKTLRRLRSNRQQMTKARKNRQPDADFTFTSYLVFAATRRVRSVALNVLKEKELIVIAGGKNVVGSSK